MVDIFFEDGTPVPNPNMKNKQSPPYLSFHVDKRLLKFLDVVKSKLISKDKDYVMLIDGYEGVGKSTFAQQAGMYVDPTLNLDRVCMTADEFKNQIINAQKGQCVIYDEAVTGMSSGESITRIGRLLKSMMMQMRQKNLFVIVILPSVFELNKYAVLSRARSLFHMYEASGKMGYWVGYNKKDLRQLYLKGKKTYSYKVYSMFRGRFGGKYTVNEELYRKKKGDALFKLDEDPGKRAMTNQQIKWYSQRDSFILALRKRGLTLQEISNETKNIAHPLSKTQIQQICSIKLEKPKEVIG